MGLFDDPTPPYSLLLPTWAAIVEGHSMTRQSNRRRPRSDFFELGLPQGTRLTFTQDSDVVAEVVDGHHLKFVDLPPDRYPGVVLDGRPRTRTDALSLLAPSHGNRSFARPNAWWRLDDGRLVTDVYNATYRTDS